MRTSAIAEELISRGEEVIFTGHVDGIPWLSKRIADLGFSSIFTDLKAFSPNPNRDVLIFDSYTTDIEDELIQPEKWRAVVAVVDDVSPKYKANLFIQPSLSTDYKNPNVAEMLSGSKYIPFRKSIQKTISDRITTLVPEVIVVGGGTDTFNFVKEMTKILRASPQDFNAAIFAVNSNLFKLDSRFTLFEAGSMLDEKARTADLVFTTASTTSLEFIAREIAVGIACATENQESYYTALSEFKVAESVGRCVKGNWALDARKVHLLLASDGLRRSLKRKTKGFIDLEGATRIVDKIISL